MKPFIFLFYFVACVTSLNAQVKAKSPKLELGNIISDSSTISLEDITKKLNLLPIKQSNCIIEIRLYSNIGFAGTQCIVMEYETKWKVAKTKLNAKDCAVKINPKSPITLEKIGQLLIAHNIFSLPTQDNIKTDNYKLDLSTGMVMLSAFDLSDAPCYYIQFKVGNKFRQYKYCGSVGYAAFYKTQHEYADFNEILKTFSIFK